MRPAELTDTDARATQVLLSWQRRMSPGERILTVFALSDMLMRLSEAGVRRLYPAADSREVFLRAAARRLGRETVARVYGWDPKTS